MKIEGTESLLLLHMNLKNLWFFRVVQSVEEEVEALFGIVEKFVQFSTTFMKIIWAKFDYK